MATKPTIFKFKIDVADLNRDYYATHSITVAQHPSETVERMLVRVLAFCANADEHLVFCKGLSDSDEADLWRHTLDGQLALWIDVGEPAVDRIRKATRVAAVVKIYCFNSRAHTWWEQGKESIAQLKVNVYRLQWPKVQELAKLAQRTMDMSVTLNGDSIYVASALGECDLTVEILQELD